MSAVQDASISATIPQTFPAVPQDWFNYIARFGTSDCEIQVVLKLTGRLITELLGKAIRLTVDAEPVLGCKFVEDDNLPRWERLQNLDGIEWLTLIADRKDMDRFLQTPMVLDNDPQVLMGLMQDEEGDTVCIKLNHASTDGGGIKDYLQLLAGIYTALTANPSFRPQPNVSALRDQSLVLHELGIVNLEAAWTPQPDSVRPTWAFPWKRIESDSVRVSKRRFPESQFKKIRDFARAHNATLNDLILTAFYRSIFQAVRPNEGSTMEIQVTVDLRRYLPDRKADAVCNLSGAENVRISWERDESMSDTLRRVKQVMDEIKQGRPGIGTAITFEFLGRLPFSQAKGIFGGLRRDALESGLCSPMFSNLGVLSSNPLVFGDVAVSDAYAVTPAHRAPGFMLGASSYANVLTLTVSHYHPETDSGDVEALMDRIAVELSKL